MSDRRGRRVRDGLALSHALPDRSLVAMVAAMSLLAALTWAGAFGAWSLSARWAHGAANLVTIQVPDPDRPASLPSDDATAQVPVKENQTDHQRSRIDAVMDVLRAQSALSEIHRLDARELDQILRPWLGTSGVAALPLPGVIELHLAPGASLTDGLSSRLAGLAPGTLVERNDDWRSRLQMVARSLLACAALAIVLVGGIGVAVIGMATRLGLGARRESIAILHGLGAADGYVASRFGRRVAWLSLAGGIAGTLLAVPPIAIVVRFMAPLSGPQAVTMPEQGYSTVLPEAFAAFTDGSVPGDLMLGFVCVPLCAMLAALLTAQIIVRIWLRRLP